MGNTATRNERDQSKHTTTADDRHLSGGGGVGGSVVVAERNERATKKARTRNNIGRKLSIVTPSTTTTTAAAETTTATGALEKTSSAAATTTTSGKYVTKEGAAVVTAQRQRQASVWSLGSLGGRFNWSFSGAASKSTSALYHNRNKAIRKSLSSVQLKRSKTSWHRPLTSTIFSTHFKTTSRNDAFCIEELIAKGAFGVVFKVSDKPRDQQQQQRQQVEPKTYYALKVLKKSKVIVENSVEQIKDEADIQKACGHHSFIVQQIDLWQNRHNLHILSEYLPNGELFSKFSCFSLDLVRLYLAEIALAIDFLHNAGIIYRDAKPENILLTQGYHIKLIDFGLSKWLKLGANTKTMCGTLQYMEQCELSAKNLYKMNARSQVFDLTMEGRQVDEAVASIFHTVLFHRCLGKYMYTGDAQYSIGTVGYTDVDCDFIDFTYVCCTSDSLHRTVKRAINLFSEKLRSNDSCGSGQISLEFFQKKKSRWPFQQECIPWEVWTIHLDLIKYENEDDRQMCRENVSDLLTEKVIYITELMNRHDYVPKTPSQSELDLIFDTSYPDVQPYLFKFDYSTTGSNVPSVGNAVKKMIKETLAL